MNEEHEIKAQRFKIAPVRSAIRDTIRDSTTYLEMLQLVSLNTDSCSISKMPKTSGEVAATSLVTQGDDFRTHSDLRDKGWITRAKWNGRSRLPESATDAGRWR